MKKFLNELSRKPICYNIPPWWPPCTLMQLRPPKNVVEVTQVLLLCRNCMQVLQGGGSWLMVAPSTPLRGTLPRKRTRINGTRYGGHDLQVVIHLDYGAAGNGWFCSWYRQGWWSPRSAVAWLNRITGQPCHCSHAILMLLLRCVDHLLL